jgi:hypothetical protein
MYGETIVFDEVDRVEQEIIVIGSDDEDAVEVDDVMEGTAGEKEIDREGYLVLLQRYSLLESATRAEGDCCPLAVLQSAFMADNDATLEMAQAYANDERCQKLRRDVEETIIKYRVFRNFLTDGTCRDIVRASSSYSLGALPDNGENWKLVARGYGTMARDGGLWFDEIAIRAMAVYLQRSITVVPPTSSLLFYPKQLRFNRGDDMEFFLVDKDKDGNNIRGSRRALNCRMNILCYDMFTESSFIPAEVKEDFNAVVINYSPTSKHYWCTQPFVCAVDCPVLPIYYRPN